MEHLMQTEGYRRLTVSEISQLESQGCKAVDWNQVQVDVAFSADNIWRVTFSGVIRLGRFSAVCQLAGGVTEHSGIYDARLHNVIVGNDCFISGIRRHIANYTLSDRVVLSDLGELVVTEETCFGIGTEVSVLNEVGGRSVLLCEQLTPQMAYLQAYYTYRSDGVASAISAHIAQLSESVRSTIGFIGAGTRIVGCNILRNIRVAAETLLEGVASLDDATIGSHCHVGHGVKASHFVMADHAVMVDGVMLERCYIDSHCHLAKCFSATDSLFFFASHLENGEACALFAGPFTVSHHKATLLIATQTSFFNAGSGSNQSNHAYKLGPNKYGLLDRGVKLASSSYLYWPLCVGAYTTVLGHHTIHADLRDFPFSYLVGGHDGHSQLIPAVALQTIGLVRDEMKWQDRGRRVAEGHATSLTYAVLNPYTATRIAHALQFLQNAETETEYIEYQGCRIPQSFCAKAMALYTDALRRYCFTVLVKQLLSAGSLSCTSAATGDWVDFGGIVLPHAETMRALSQIADTAPQADTPASVWMQAFESPSYTQWEWNKVAQLLHEVWQIEVEELTASDIVNCLNELQNRLHTAYDRWTNDALKEYAPAAAISYGMDGDEDARTTDFEQVMGNIADDSTLRRLRKLIESQLVDVEKAQQLLADR